MIHLLLNVFVELIHFLLKFLSSLFRWEIAEVLWPCSLQSGMEGWGGKEKSESTQILWDCILKIAHKSVQKSQWSEALLSFVYELSAPEWLGIRTSKKQAQDHVPLPYQVANGRPARMPEFSGKAENLLLTHS